MENEGLMNVFRLLEGEYGFQDWWPAENPFEVTIGAILTQNTAWTNVEKAIRNLKNEGLLSPQKIRDAPLPHLKKLIRPSGYYNIKALKLKKFIEFLYVDSDGHLEAMKKESLKSLREKLLSVWGIGEETADSILCYALEKKSFVVDAYTKRIMIRLGYVKNDVSYDELKRLVEKHIPADLGFYKEFHALFVAHGKTTCTKNSPRCSQCVLYAESGYSNAKSCPK
ncbi:MAG: hypothetical protein ABH950_02595 [Candidatus Altiarchaeota archaeon]